MTGAAAGTRPFRPGYVFRESDGALLVFEKDGVSVIKSNPPSAWRRTESRRAWHPIRPSLNLIADYLSVRKQRRDHLPSPTHYDRNSNFAAEKSDKRISRRWQAYKKWCAKIDPEIKTSVARFSFRHWQLLNLLCRTPGKAALELSYINPSLFFMLAVNHIFHNKPAVQRPLRSARALLKRPTAQSLAWLGFPRVGCKKVMAKIAPASAGTLRLLYCRQLLCAALRPDPDRIALKAYRAMCHTPKLNTGNLRWLCDPVLSPFAHQSLIDEIGNQRTQDKRADTAALMKDAMNLQRIHDRPIVGGRIFRSIRAVREAHDALVEAVGYGSDLHGITEFPPAPFPGEEGRIVPLSTPEALRKASADFHNCSWAGHAHNVATQNIYFYLCHSDDEPAMFSLVKGYDRRWRPGDIKGPRNEFIASAKIHAIVDAWLAKHCGGTFMPDRPDMSLFPYVGAGPELPLDFEAAEYPPSAHIVQDGG